MVMARSADGKKKVDSAQKSEKRGKKMRSCGNHILSWGFLLKKNSQNSTKVF
jgi:hypothetical protein